MRNSVGLVQRGGVRGAALADECTISRRSGDGTVLEPNMTIHFLPGIWMDDWGVAISEAIRIAETGAKPFCCFPRKLFVK